MIEDSRMALIGTVGTVIITFPLFYCEPFPRHESELFDTNEHESIFETEQLASYELRIECRSITNLQFKDQNIIR